MGFHFKKPMFPLGQTYATQGVIALEIDIAPILHRHQCGDWGDLGTEDKEANEIALLIGERILSCYESEDSKIYIITEWDRSMTTVMLAEEY